MRDASASRLRGRGPTQRAASAPGLRGRDVAAAWGRGSACRGEGLTRSDTCPGRRRNYLSPPSPPLRRERRALPLGECRVVALAAAQFEFAAVSH